MRAGVLAAGTPIISWTCNITAVNQRFSVGYANMTVQGSNVSGQPGSTVQIQYNISNPAGPDENRSRYAYRNRFGTTTQQVSNAVGQLTIQAGTRTGTASTNYDACVVNNNVLDCPTLNTEWAPNATGSVTVTATIPANAVPGSVYELCGLAFSITTNNWGGNNTATGCSHVTVSQLVADQAITGAAQLNVDSGSPYNLQFNYVNNGTASVQAPRVTFTLPASLASATVGATGWNCTPAPATTRTCDRTTPAPQNTTAQFNVQGTVPADSVAGSQLGAVTATVGHAANAFQYTDPNPNNNTATTTINVNSGVTVAVSKTRTTAEIIDPGQQASFTVTITNSGANRVNGITFNDTLPEGFGAWTWTCVATGTGSACPAAGGTAEGTSFSQTGINLAVGGTATYTFTATASAAGAQGTTATTTRTNTASAVMPTGVTNSVTASSSATVQVRNTSDIAVAEQAMPITPGATQTLTVPVTNAAGPAIQRAVTATITLPSGITAAPTGLPSGCTANAPRSVVTCAVQTLAAGATTNLQIPVTSAGTLGAGTLTGQVSVAYGLERNTANDTAALSFNVGAASTDFAVVSASGQTGVTPGENGSLSTRIVNNGPSTSVAAAPVTVSAAQHVTFVAAGLPADCTLTSPTTVSCTLPAGMAVGEGRTLDIPYTVAAAAQPGTTYAGGSVTVDAGSADTSPANNTAAWSHQTGARSADLALDKALGEGVDPGSVTPGQQVVYILTVQNHGPSYATGDVLIVDQLPADVTYLSHNDPAWSCSPAARPDGGQDVTCSRPGDFPVGTTELRLTVLLAPGAEQGVRTNSATVSSSTPDSDESNNRGTVDRRPPQRTADPHQAGGGRPGGPRRDVRLPAHRHQHRHLARDRRGGHGRPSGVLHPGERASRVRRR